MTVDLTKLKAGGSVKIRCGAILEAMTDVKANSGTGVYINFNGYEQSMYYYWHNSGLDTNLTTPFDILEIIPAPFDWDKVEQGDAFERLPLDVVGTIVHFVAEDFTDKKYVLAGEIEDGLMETAIFLSKDSLKPRPDIPNAKK